MVREEFDLYLLRQLEKTPNVSQRDLARSLGASLGKVNYCLTALMQRGLVKAQNFLNSQNKLAYAYLLTPSGVEEKAVITARFLRNKIAEYEALESQIEQLKREVAQAPQLTAVSYDNLNAKAASIAQAQGAASHQAATLDKNNSQKRSLKKPAKEDRT
jgi:EPS-associated MarR family transcriptional regulator